MFLMTSRSSRFFVVLLHLMGVSTHLPSNLPYWMSETGIVGVNPLSIVLEVLDLNHMDDDHYDVMQPHWLQDSTDGTCLGPIGFSECGDATLWLLLPKQRKDSKWKKWIRWATEEEEDSTPQKPQGYALQLVDDDSYLRTLLDANNTKSASSRSSPTDDYKNKECLTRRRKDSKLVLGSCSNDKAWSWQVNGEGVLYLEQPKSRKQQHQKKRHLKKPSHDCVWRSNTEAALRPCDGQAPTDVTEEDEQRVVQFALVRQATASSSSRSTSSSTSSRIEAQDESSSSVEHEEKSSPPLPTTEETTTTTSSVEVEEPLLSSPVDIAHANAHAWSSLAMHPLLQQAQLRHSATLSFPSNPAAAPKSKSGAKPKPRVGGNMQLQFLMDTNAILLAGDQKENAKQTRAAVPQSPLHDLSSQQSIKPVIRKIRKHPYIEESKNEIWTDSKTGLAYRTDLCSYLGDDRKEKGRHTLTGVGLYMRTVFNIKVYGVAFYVSKRDLLADPNMKQYASLEAEEIRTLPDFYSMMRHMATPTDPNAGKFDRTLLLKTNMQLSTETMRSSLESDWKMLTEEGKYMLINSSLQPRPASTQMLKIIQDPDNPSKCSCAQVAPDEIESDPSCCARGTELVFTWRKNGALEVRLNGDFMDSFPRPDVAAGIFYEYLRGDDPMSPDFLEHIVDGFPFLLAPLAQVEGVGIPVRSKPALQKPPTSTHYAFKAIGGVSEVVLSTATGFADAVQYGASGVTGHAMNTARTVGGIARTLGGEVLQKRDILGKRMSSLAHQAISTLYGKDEKPLTVLPKWLEDLSNLNVEDNTSGESNGSGPPRGRIFRKALLPFFGQKESPAAPDEIVPMIHPPTQSSQRFFLGMVHLYLLLLLIVSFPAHLTTRTKSIIVRKSAQSIPDSDISDSDSSSEEEYLTPQTRAPLDPLHAKKASSAPMRFRLHADEAASSGDGKIKKSLSYVL